MVGASMTMIFCQRWCDHDGLLLPPLQNAAALRLHLNDARIAVVQTVDLSLVMYMYMFAATKYKIKQLACKGLV